MSAKLLTGHLGLETRSTVTVSIVKVLWRFGGFTVLKGLCFDNDQYNWDRIFSKYRKKQKKEWTREILSVEISASVDT